jgi:hypothetical protein
MRFLRVGAALACVAAIALIASAAMGADQARPPSNDVSVSHVDDGKRRPCGKLTADAKGGCSDFITSRNRLRFTVRTLAGDMPFARCLYNYDLQIDGSGRTLIDGMISAGKNPCNDVRPCPNAKHTDWLPWHGRIERRAGGFIHRVDACVDTCLGQFKGELIMRLEERGGSWRATAVQSQVGSSGFVFDDGSWDLTIRGLDIRPAS